MAGQAYGKTLRWRWFRNRKKGDLEDKKDNLNSQKKMQQAEEAVLYTHMQSEPSGVLIPAQCLLVTWAHHQESSQETPFRGFWGLGQQQCSVWQLWSSGRVTKGSPWAGADWQGQGLSSPGNPRSCMKQRKTNTAFLQNGSSLDLPEDSHSSWCHSYSPHSKLLLAVLPGISEIPNANSFAASKHLTIALPFSAHLFHLVHGATSSS